MARTGITIRPENTTLSGIPQVNANTMLIVQGAAATTGGSVAFTLGIPYLIRSVSDLETYGIDETNNPALYKEVSDFYRPMSRVSNNGTVLWIVGIADDTVMTEALYAQYVRATVVNGFQFRPRQIMYSPDPSNTWASTEVTNMQNAIDSLYEEGYSMVGAIGHNGLGADYTAAADLSTLDCPMVGVVIVTDVKGGRACIGALAGLVSAVSVGTSIGDGSLLNAFRTAMWLVDDAETAVVTLSKNDTNTLGDKQYMFTITRPPNNGLWWNDGATAVGANTALSTLEAGRVLASIVDDAREFFNPYINSKTPVDSTGDIRADYKTMVLQNLRSQVIQPYIDSGDISDAEVNLEAQNNDMVGTRTWVVTISVLGSPTLRLVDGYVFYVTSLNS